MGVADRLELPSKWPISIAGGGIKFRMHGTIKYLHVCTHGLHLSNGVCMSLGTSDVNEDEDSFGKLAERQCLPPKHLLRFAIAQQTVATTIRPQNLTTACMPVKRRTP